MDNHNWPPDFLHYRLRTARQKKRLQKKDYDKQLIQLDKKRSALWEAKHKLPRVPLKEPYQKGWKRVFVLREDVRVSRYGAFYEQLLTKINTVVYSNDKRFRRYVRRRRQQKKVYEDIPQSLKQFHLHEWTSPKLKLTEGEKLQFHLEDRWSEQQKMWVQRYVINEPWRYVLKVRPHIITEAKLVDNLLEQEISELDNYICSHHLDGRIRKLTNGRREAWKDCRGEKEKYKSPFKNKPRHTILDECEQQNYNCDEQFKN
jgi:hypothetical protein